MQGQFRKNFQRRGAMMRDGLESEGATMPDPARGARPAGRIGHRGPLALESVPHHRPPPLKVFPKLSLHRRPSSRIVLLRTGA